MLGLISRSYKAWRVFDANLIVLNKLIPCQNKFTVAPATLTKVFGPPGFHEMIEGTSGIFNFEDSNLDVFKLIDHNHVKEFVNPKFLKLKYKPYSHRNDTENRPSIKEFWESKIPVDFWLEHSDYADIANFTKWLKEKISKNEDLQKRLIEKFGPIDHSNDYKKKYEISKDFALFRYNKIKWD